MAGSMFVRSSRSTVTLISALAIIACGSGDSATGDDVASDGAEAVDTVSFSRTAAGIAELEIDTVRLAGWRPSVMVAGRLMLDPQALETLGSISEGRISSVPVRVGDRVSAGQALVMIHSHEIMDARNALVRAKAQLDAAIARRDLARTELGRAQRLFAARAMSRADLERAEVADRVGVAAYDEAMAEQDRVLALIEHLVGTGPVPPEADEHDVLIRTPIAGVVTERVAQPGAVVLPGMPLVTVGNPTRLQLQLRLSEAAAEGVVAGSTVRYALTDAPGRWYRATITRVAPTVDTLTRTIEVLAKPQGEGGGKAESFVQAEIQGRESTDVLVIPPGAVQTLEGDTVVFVATPHNDGYLLRVAPVSIGRSTTDRVEVLSGLEKGALVVSRGAAIAKAELLKRRGELGE